MSRYRSYEEDLAYGDAPSPQRWDASRFQRESSGRGRGPAPPVITEKAPYRSTRGPIYEEDDRYYERDRERDSYGPRGEYRQSEQRYYEDDRDVYYDPRRSQGAMIPFRPAPPSRPARPARPGMIRRQSSVDRLDFEVRRETRRGGYDDYRYGPPPQREEIRYSRYDRRPDFYYDDVQIAEPDRYGDDGFREYREREWIRNRSRTREEEDRKTVIDDRKSSVAPSAASEKVEEKIVEKREEVIKEEKPYPRRGKTRMPKRLVHTKVLFDLGYPFYEEDEKTILIEKALGPDNIDEVFAKSKEYREREVVTTKLIEAPPPSESTVIAPPPPQSVYSRHETVNTKPISEAPRSVREWDQMSIERDRTIIREKSISPRSSISRATTRRSRSHGGRHEVEEIHEHEHEHFEEHESDHAPSRAPTRASRKSRRESRRERESSDDETIIEKRKTIIREDDYGESNSIHMGPLALVVDNKRDRTDADIKDEIRRLERERRDLRRDSEYTTLRVEREGRIREPSPTGEISVERRGSDLVEIRRDKRARSRSRVKPPSAGLLKSMMYTVT